MKLIYWQQAKTNPSKNARLSDVCLGTSAAPTFLPSHYFETQDHKGKTRTFDLIDGGVAANNPVSVYIKIRKGYHKYNTFKENVF